MKREGPGWRGALPGRAALLGGAALLVLALLAGCASRPQVMSDFDENVDFARFRTYAWPEQDALLVAPMAEPLNPLLESRIKTAFEAAMTARGLERVEAVEAADLVARFTVGARDQIRIDTWNTGTHRTAAGRGYWGTSTEVRARSYTEGQLAIDLFDARSGAPVWHGTSTDTIRRSDRRDQQALVDRMVDAIMTRYPPR